MATTTTAVYTVDGMSCGHCVNSVTQEVGAVAGVTDVQVDLGAKKVTVTGEGTVDDAAVRAAIDEAGYEVRS
ncbi:MULTISPECIES: heavy-metal-associated domain-containing protein [unclassified Nocardiopsis]|jgi:copper chaperone CopZ|uniref:heavy-metal-associated domain-containing protein n=1 Tax=Nocardiopsis TaxID=2013 RepID=UPI00387AE553